jgi:signal transduction histidine kinase
MLTRRQRAGKCPAVPGTHEPRDQFAAAVDELAAADRLKDELIACSHELRSPLTYIMGYVDLLVAGEMGEPGRTAEQPEIVAAKTRKLARLVSDILALEKSQTEDLRLAPANLADIAQQAIQEISHSAAEVGIEIATEFDPDVGPVLVDAGRIEQVFINLLGNALKFSPAGGTLSVRIVARGPQARAEVVDKGIGIPEDKLARIFDRFYQVDIESRRHYGGVGLGLAICKQIIEAHGGRIGVTSTLGVGSTFYFELPRISPPDRSTDVNGPEDSAGLHT